MKFLLRKVLLLLMLLANKEIFQNLYASANLSGKKRDKVIDFVDEGVFHIERLKKDGWITDIKYDDEV